MRNYTKNGMSVARKERIMKKIASLAMALLLGTGALAAVSSADLPCAHAKKLKAEHSIAPAIECIDNKVFKVAEFRGERNLQEYRLQKYDVINFIAYGHDGGIGVSDVQIGVDGMIRLPYVGSLRIIGLTLDEARDLIHEKLSKYYKLPEFNIYMKNYGPRKVYVMGNVNSPGEKELSIDSMNVYAAISKGGGVDKRGRSKHIQVIRQLEGVMYYKEINLDAFVKKHDLTQNLALEDGDIIYVPDSNKVVFSEDIAPYIDVFGTYKALTN